MCNQEIIRSAAMVTRSDHRRRLTRRTAIGGGLGLAAAASMRAPTGRARGQGDAALASRQVVDLTHRLSPEFPVYPGYTPFSATVTSTIDGIGSLSRQVTMEEHVGTHVDAPAHFIAGSDDVSAIPPERLVAPLAILDIAARVRDDDDATVSVDDILAWEDEHGLLPAGSFVAMRSGWDSRASDADAFLNVGDDGLLHFPAWSPAAAAFLVEERDIVGVGVDTISMDNTTSPTFESHVILLGAGLYGVENLAGLGDVPVANATIVVGAPRFAEGSGGPARVLALI